MTCVAIDRNRPLANTRLVHLVEFELFDEHILGYLEGPAQSTAALVVVQDRLYTGQLTCTTVTKITYEHALLAGVN